MVMDSEELKQQVSIFWGPASHRESAPGKSLLCVREFREEENHRKSPFPLRARSEAQPSGRPAVGGLPGHSQQCWASRPTPGAEGGLRAVPRRVSGGPGLSACKEGRRFTPSPCLDALNRAIRTADCAGRTLEELRYLLCSCGSPFAAPWEESALSTAGRVHSSALSPSRSQQPTPSGSRRAGGVLLSCARSWRQRK